MSLYRWNKTEKNFIQATIAAPNANKLPERAFEGALIRALLAASYRNVNKTK